MSKKQPTRGQTLAKAIIGEYKPKTVEDMQNALKDGSSGISVGKKCRFPL